MEITVRERTGVQILNLAGRLTLGGGAGVLHEAVRTELDQGHKRLLLHLAEVSFVDSTGLGRLVASLTSAHSRNAVLKLLSPTPKIEDVLEITRTSQLFEIFHDEEEAVRSFADQ